MQLNTEEKGQNVCVCVRACVRAFVRACVRVCGGGGESSFVCKKIKNGGTVYICSQLLTKECVRLLFQCTVHYNTVLSVGVLILPFGSQVARHIQ